MANDDGDGRDAGTTTAERKQAPKESEPSDDHKDEDKSDKDESEKGEGKSDTDDKDEAKSDDKPPARPFYKRPLLMLFLLALLIAAAVGGYFYWQYDRQFESTDDAFIDAHIVQMEAKVNGYVVNLLIEDNQLVEVGQLLVEIDPRDYQASLDQMRAAEVAAATMIDQAKAQLNESKAALATAKANVNSAAAATQRDVAELDRLKPLKGSGAITAQEYSVAVAAAESSKADESSARAKVAEAEATISTNQAALETAKAQLEQAAASTRAAEVTLSHTKITAPIAGRVTRRTVEKGNFVQQGTSLFALVDQVPWVTANFKETKLTYMEQGQAVSIHIDTYPDRELAGHINSFQRGSGQRFSLLPPENATGNYVKVVQRIPVKILFNEPPPKDMVLGPGMSVVPTVKVR